MPDPITSAADNAELFADLQARYKHHKYWASSDFNTAQWFAWLAIISSFASSICAALDINSKAWMAIIAATPGLFVATAKTFPFSTRAKWHSKCAIQYRNFITLARTLSADELIKQVTEFDLKMADVWPDDGAIQSTRADGKF